MFAHTRSLAAIFALVALAACSPGEEPSIVAEARASTPANYDYGWRTPQSASAIADGAVYEYH
jgi:hypothetical protein